MNDENKLTHDDYESVLELLKISEKIRTVYNIFTSDKDEITKRQKNLLKNILKGLLIKEEELLKSLGNNTDKLTKINLALLDDCEYNRLDVLFDITENNKNQIIKNRLADQITDLIDKYEAEDLQFKYDDFLYRRDPANEMLGNYYLESSIEIDIIKMILYFLNLYIKDSKYSDFKKELINFKNNIMISFNFLREQLIDEKMKQPELFWNSKLVADLTNKSKSYLDSTKNEYAEDLLFEQVEPFINVLIDNSNENKFMAIISEIFIRTGILFSTPSTYLDFCSFLKQELESFELSKQSKKAIFTYLDQFKKDKELVRVLSFRQ